MVANPGDDTVCITQEEYQALMAQVQKIDQVIDTVGRLDEAIRGNGKPGLETRVTVLERLNPVYREQAEISRDKIDDMAKLRVEHVKGSSISWQVLAMFAVNILLIIGTYFLGK